MTKNNSSDNVSELLHAIDGSPLEELPCICGGKVNHFVVNAGDRWICEECCGAAGESYEEAVTEKFKFELRQIALKARNILKETQFLINLENPEVFVTTPQAREEADGINDRKLLLRNGHQELKKSRNSHRSVRRREHQAGAGQMMGIRF